MDGYDCTLDQSSYASVKSGTSSIDLGSTRPAGAGGLRASKGSALTASQQAQERVNARARQKLDGLLATQVTGSVIRGQVE